MRTVTAACLLTLAALSPAARAQQSAPAAPRPADAAPATDLTNRPVLEVVPAWAVKPADRNAALLYWAASAHVTQEYAVKLGELDWEKVGDEWLLPNLPQEFVELAASIKDTEVLTSTARAASLAKCDFEIPYEYGIGALMPHLGKMRQLARFVRVDARFAIAENQPDRAADRISTLLRIALHADNDRIIISSLVGNAIMDLAKNETHVLLKSGRLTEPARAKLLAAYKAIPASDPNGMKDAISTEGDVFIKWADIAYLQKGEKKEFFHDVVALASGGTVPESFAPFEKLSVEQLRGELDAARETFAKIIAVWGDDDVADKVKAILADVEKSRHGAFVKLLLPTFSRIIDNQARNRVEIKTMIEQLERPVDGR